MTEFWLQKKAFNSWSHVTWYATFEEAKINFDRMKDSSGYSWRIVEAKVVEECLLEGERPAMKQEEDYTEEGQSRQAKNWGGWDKLAASDQGKANAASWHKSNGGPISSHGLAGKVWLVNHNLKQKKRVDPTEVENMIAAGWVRGGPRTVV